MSISQLVWNEEIIEHIARHDVTPEEVEEVCFSGPLILRSKQAAKGNNPLYYALGRTESGRYLFIVFVRFKHARAMVVTARDMNQAEKKYYRGRVGK